jgi:hypothetical protein
MVVLSDVNLVRVTRRISSGDAGTPCNPPLTQDEIRLGGRLEDFWLLTARGDDNYGYSWTFPIGTTKPQAKAAVIQWFKNGKGAPISPMTRATEHPPPEEWDTNA